MLKKRKQIPILIISLKGSKRIKFLKNRLNKLKLKFKIIEGINGRKLNKEKKLDKYFKKKIIRKKTGRDMSASEIGAAASHLKAYKYIVKKKIQRAVIFEDDAFPSLKFSNWIKNTTFNEPNSILSFFAYPSGHLNKNNIKKYLLNKIKVHIAKTHIYSNSCYMLNNQTAKKILKITEGKVIGYADWGFNTLTDEIKLYLTLPFIVLINDRGFSDLGDDRNKILNKSKSVLNKLIPDQLLYFPKILYYILFIPFILGKYKDFQFYYEHFFIKNYFKFKNLFIQNEIDLVKTSYNRKFFIEDLRKEFDKRSKLL